MIWGGRDHQGRDRNSQTEIMGRERGVDLLIDWLIDLLKFRQLHTYIIRNNDYMDHIDYIDNKTIRMTYNLKRLV